jgi:D-sedoheptulose 7-phosphate isomerase
MHFAEELTGRFRAERRALPAIACTDAGHITCTANDYGFEQVFSRWVAALGKPGDVLIVLSTSGNSVNILRAVEAARAGAIDTIALLGKDGGKLANTCEYEWIVRPAAGADGDKLPADRIQEIHMLVLHTLIECVERRLFPENY